MSNMSEQDYFRFTPASVAWYDINVHSKMEQGMAESIFKTPEKKTHIIRNVSGQVKAGSTLAIMGASGAGKTTLLNVLTARNISNFFVDGVVKINGQLADVDMITSMSAYVQQDDMFWPLLTVREHMVFQSIVRMEQHIPEDYKIQRINEVMKELSLEKCAETRVGGVGFFKGISGGEMKRLAFALEILTNPSIMFCDEPTSGLDAFMASNLVSIMNRLAKSGRTIICTIHQPSSETFDMFQNLLLMADGRVAYLGQLHGAMQHFLNLGLKCPLNYNPADFYIHELAIAPGQEIECKRKVEIICNRFEEKQPKLENKNRQSSFVTKKIKASRYKASGWRQYCALTWRSYLLTLRQPILTYIRLGQALLIAAVLALLYANQYYDQRGVWNINGALFILIICLTMQNAFAVINVFCAELPIFMREHNNGMYRVDSYFMAKNLAEIPIFVLIPWIIVLIYYYSINLYPSFDSFLLCLLVSILTSACGVAFGYLISCMCKTTDIALSLGPPLVIPLQLLGGFYLNTKTIPHWLTWAKYVSWFHYAYDLLVKNQWSNVIYLNCTKDLPSAVQSSSTSASHFLTMSPIWTTTKSHDRTGSQCFTDGHQVLSFLDLGHDPEWANWFALILVTVLMRFCAYLFLFYWARHR